MSAGYDDDRYDGDRYDDRRDDDDRRDGGRRDSVVERARQRVKTPAVVLLVAGAVGLVLALVSVVNVFSMDKTFVQIEEQWDNDPNLTPQQRQDMKRMLGQYKDALKVGLPISIGLSVVTGIVTIVGAIQMMNLSGRGLAILGSILSMLPFVSGCCCLGMPVGIWVLLVLSNADVKAGFAAAARSRTRDGY